MKKKRMLVGVVLMLGVCIFCNLTVFAEDMPFPKIDASDFSFQTSLVIFKDGSWKYYCSCCPTESSKYEINVDIRCNGKEKLTSYPQMTVVISHYADGWEHIVAKKLTIKVADNVYEYQLLESDPPWNADIRVGTTFLLPSDNALLEDFASAKECTLIAETDVNIFTWVVKGKAYEKHFLPFIQDMLKYDFLHNVEDNKITASQIQHSPTRIAYKSIISESDGYSLEPERGEDYSFSEDYEAINRVAKSIFYVEMYDEKKNYIGSATGFVSFDEHLFVTNEHVINGASYLVICDEDNRRYILNQVVAVDKDHDIALLMFSDGIKYTSLTLELNGDLKRGMSVVAIGSPEGFQGTVSTGIISAFPILEKYAGVKCIQYSAPTSSWE